MPAARIYNTWYYEYYRLYEEDRQVACHNPIKIEEKKFNNRRSIMERTSATTAMARGILNKPAKESTKPINQIINQVKVLQKKTLANRARIKPAIPMLFKRCVFFIIFGDAS